MQRVAVFNVGKFQGSLYNFNLVIFHFKLFKAALGDSRVLGVAKDLFKQHNDNGVSIPACLREAVYKALMVQGTRYVYFLHFDVTLK